MTNKIILFSAPYMIPFLDRFRPELEAYDLELIVPEVQERLSEAELLTYAGTFDGAICGDDCYSEKVLRACAPRLKVISKWGTGIDSIDRQAALNLGIQVRNSPNAFTTAVADTVIGYLLAFTRQLPWMDQAVKSGIWAKIPGCTLSERTLGVVGIGNIGKAVVRRVKAFGMKVLGTDIIDIDHVFLTETGLEIVTLEELLQRSDFVSINCDLNPSSYHLINAHTLDMMKPSAVVINTARGPIIDERALVNALREGKIGGAAMDVFENEPLPTNHPFLSMENVMLAAHNANSSPQAWERVHRNTIQNLLNGLGINTEI